MNKLAKLLLVVLLSVPCLSQTWVGIVPSSRASDWSMVGVVQSASIAGTVTVDAVAKTITRSTGSFVTDGVPAKNNIRFFGFSNSGNNKSATYFVTNVTALTLTLSDPGNNLVSETTAPGIVTYQFNAIPNRTSIYQTINESDCMTGGVRFDCMPTIQMAINNAAANQVVALGVGSFLAQSQLKLPTNKVLRGQGASKTTIIDQWAPTSSPQSATLITTVGSLVASTLQMSPGHAWSPTLMSAPGTTTLGSFCNNGSGPSLSRGSNCFGVSSTASMQLDAVSTTYGPQGWVLLSLEDDASSNLTGGLNPSTATTTSVGSGGWCTNCDNGEQRYWYGAYGNSYASWTANHTYALNSFVSLTAAPYSPYIWQNIGHSLADPTCTVACTTGASQPFPALTNPPTIGSTTVVDNPGPNQITWIAVAPGSRSQGQISKITHIDTANNVITIDQPLISDYPLTRNPHALPVGLINNVGIEDLQLYYDQEGGATNGVMVDLSGVYNGWIKGVEWNYGLFLPVALSQSENVSFVNNYLSNNYRHNSNTTGDMGLSIRGKTTNFLVQNNTFERLHVSIMPEWGSAHGVIAYNYAHGAFHRTNGLAQSDFGTHGAYPQDILWEGNDTLGLGEDNYWGNYGNQVYFRNYLRGVSQICGPLTIQPPDGITYGITYREAVVCNPMGSPYSLYWPSKPDPQVSPTGVNGFYGFQVARGFSIPNIAVRSVLVANVVGSPAQTQLTQYSNTAGVPGLAVPYYDKVWAICGTGVPSPNPAMKINCGTNSRPYSSATGYSFGYDSNNSTGTAFDDSLQPWTGVNALTIDRDYDFLADFLGDPAQGIWSWNPLGALPLPASFYLNGAPDWIGSLPWPMQGSDVTSGSSTYRGHIQAPCTIPAACVEQSLGGTNIEGGEGSPYAGWDETLFYGATTTHNLTFTFSANGTVTSSPPGINCGSTCTAAFNANSSVTLTAAPAAGYTVNAWTGMDSACTGAVTCTITMNGDKSASVSYTSIATYQLVLSGSNGTVVPSPLGANCGTGCYSYASGTGVAVVANPNPGYQFSGWTVTSGTCTGIVNPCSVTMSGNVNLTANFTPIIPTPNVNINGSVLIQGGVKIN